MLFFKRKKEFMEWNDYKNRINQLEIFWWQQSVRKHNLRT